MHLKNQIKSNKNFEKYNYISFLFERNKNNPNILHFITSVFWLTKVNNYI